VDNAELSTMKCFKIAILIGILSALWSVFGSKLKREIGVAWGEGKG